MNEIRIETFFSRRFIEKKKKRRQTIETSTVLDLSNLYKVSRSKQKLNATQQSRRAEFLWIYNDIVFRENHYI